jgi:hypothetical protein
VHRPTYTVRDDLHGCVHHSNGAASGTKLNYRDLQRKFVQLHSRQQRNFESGCSGGLATYIELELQPVVLWKPCRLYGDDPDRRTLAATGTVSILEAGQTQPIGTITLSGNPATGTFTTSMLPVGTDVITATYPGDVSCGSGASSAVNQIVSQATTATVVSSSPNPGIAGKTQTITATVTVTQGVSTPTGTVTFTDTASRAGFAYGPWTSSTRYGRSSTMAGCHPTTSVPAFGSRSSDRLYPSRRAARQLMPASRSLDRAISPSPYELWTCSKLEK